MAEPKPWEMDWSGVRIDPAKPTDVATGGTGTAKQTGDLRERLEKLRVIRKTLADARREFRDLEQPRSAVDGISSGILGGFLPTQQGMEFDAAVSRVTPQIKGLVRTPGEGAFSDYDAKLLAQSLPNRRTYNSVTRQSLDAYDQIVNEYEAALRSALGEQPMQAAPVGGAPTQGPRRIKVDRMGRPIK